MPNECDSVHMKTVQYRYQTCELATGRGRARSQGACVFRFLNRIGICAYWETEEAPFRYATLYMYPCIGGLGTVCTVYALRSLPGADLICGCAWGDVQFPIVLGYSFLSDTYPDVS
jgi:hypothetical protein